MSERNLRSVPTLSKPISILKADLLRYPLLFAKGGILSDLDVSCEDTPIQDWIPEKYKKNANLILGWEFVLALCIFVLISKRKLSLQAAIIPDQPVYHFGLAQFGFGSQLSGTECNG